MEEDIREYKIVIGSKAYFDDQVRLLEEKLAQEYDDYFIENFLELVRLSDDRKQRGNLYTDNDKASVMLVKNHNYHGIVETAHDRLGSLIEELTTADAIIYIHNPQQHWKHILKDFIHVQRLSLIMQEKHMMLSVSQINSLRI